MNTREQLKLIEATVVSYVMRERDKEKAEEELEEIKESEKSERREEPSERQRTAEKVCYDIWCYCRRRRCCSRCEL